MSSSNGGNGTSNTQNESSGQNNVNNNQNSSKEGFGSKLVNGIGDARNAYNSYKANGGLGGMAKNAIGNKINDKINDKKDQLKDAAKNKVNNAKNKINDKLPDSVKKKRDAVKGKMDAAKKKLNAPKEKLDAAKQKINDAKQKLNEKTFKGGLRTAANAIAPGSGVAAEKMLDTPVGKPALDAARNASNPVSALKEGTKKLVSIIIKKEVVKKVALSLVSSFGGLIIFLLLISSITKFGDSQTYAHGPAYGDNSSLSEIDEKYTKFYENVEYYSGKYGADKAMIIATLTAYQDNEIYSDMDSTDDTVEDVDPDEDANGDGVTELSVSKMKKYIKKVGKAISDSGNNITEGDYVTPGSGSDYFWWLYDDFVKDYYKDYFSSNMTNEELANKKKEIIEFIYLYYEDIKDDIGTIGTGVSSLCPSGVTVVNGKYPGVYSTEDYIAGVVKAEMGGYSDEVRKAFAVAARSLLASVKKCEVNASGNFQAFKSVDKSDPSDKPYFDAASATAGMVLVRKDGSILNAQYVTVPISKYRSLDTSTGIWTFNMLHDSTDPSSTYVYKMKYSDAERIAKKATPEIGIFYPSESSGHHWGMVSYGAVYEAEQGKTYDQILNIFYGNNISISQSAGATSLGGSDVFSESVFPISEVNKDLYISAGYYGYYRKDGSPHGAMDISCRAGGLNCQKYKIIASHAGIVTDINREVCNRYSQEAANKTGIPYKSDCNGTSLIVKVTSGTYTGYKFLYWHFSSIDPSIKIGSNITAGQYLGQLGNTGNSSGPHLHFEIQNASGAKLNIDKSIEAILPAPHL